MKPLWGIVVLLALLGPATASAAPIATCPSAADVSVAAAVAPPVAVVVMNGNCYSFDARPITDERSRFQWEIPHTTVDLGGGDSFFLQAQFDVDPMVSYMFGDVNATGTTLNFDVYFTTFATGGPYDQHASSLSATQTVSAPDTTGTVTYNPSALSTAYQEGYTDMVDAIANSMLAGISPCTSTFGPATSCASATASNSILPINPDFLTARISYVHDKRGNGTAQATFEGSVEITAAPVPEPATFALLGAGLTIVMWRRLRR